MIRNLKDKTWLSSFEDGSLVISTLIKVQEWYMRTIYFLVWMLILYIIYLNKERIIFSSQSFSNVSNLVIYDSLTIWQLLRNKLLKVVYFDILIMIPIGIHYFRLEKYAKFTKMIYRWFMLFVFIIFSFAISGLVTDITNMLIALNFVILNK